MVLPRRSIDDAQAGFASRVVGRSPSFRPVVKDQSPLRGNPCGLGLGRAPDSVALCRPEQHVPSPTAGKNELYSNLPPRLRRRFVNPAQCLSASKKIFHFFQGVEKRGLRKPRLVPAAVLEVCVGDLCVLVPPRLVPPSEVPPDALHGPQRRGRRRAPRPVACACARAKDGSAKNPVCVLFPCPFLYRGSRGTFSFPLPFSSTQLLITHSLLTTIPSLPFSPFGLCFVREFRPCLPPSGCGRIVGELPCIGTAQGSRLRAVSRKVLLLADDDAKRNRLHRGIGRPLLRLRVQVERPVLSANAGTFCLGIP